MSMNHDELFSQLMIIMAQARLRRSLKKPVRRAGVPTTKSGVGRRTVPRAPRLRVALHETSRAV